ncbi:sugar ABC transporter substrate-binding protein [uncultured Clostridium sp.]|uniref:ABC transporter substrate-binding protein n=1 Tax=uncultured Clostridium sp. TaxID=59620 RepID=UPI0025FBD141|nr:sugar ABC transporter substrate-binding protein [uncultured Clostridium sp.]
MKKNIKKIISCIAMSAMIGTSLMGCGGNGSSKSSSGETTITYSIWDKIQEPGMRKIADEFESENPGIKVNIEVTPWDQYWTKMEAAASGGSLPDVFWMHASQVEKYIRGNAVMDLTENIKSSSTVDMSKFPKDLVKLYEQDGKNYAIPKDYDTVGLWYNKTLFDEAGIAYPDETWTWDTLLENAKKLTNTDKGIYGLSAPLNTHEGIYNYVFQNEGRIVSEDGTKSEYNTPATREALQWYLDLSLKEGVSPNQSQFAENSVITLFESGKTAMALFGSWMTSEFASNEYTSANCDVAVLAEGKTRGTVYNGLGNSVSAKTKNPEAAWKFVEFLGSEKANTIQAESGAAIPAYEGTSEAWIKSNDKFNLSAFTEMLDYATIKPYIKNNSKWETTENNILKKVFSGDLSVDEGCKQLEDEMNAIINE